MGYPRQNTIVDVDQKTALQAQVTLANPGTDRCWRIRKVYASYSSGSQAGTLTITNVRGPGGAARTITRDLVGSTVLEFDESGVMTLPGVAPVITLTAGAATIVGNLTAYAFPE
jgi:hypothetical protein